jgi:hypothetical protein
VAAVGLRVGSTILFNALTACFWAFSEQYKIMTLRIIKWAGSVKHAAAPAEIHSPVVTSDLASNSQLAHHGQGGGGTGAGIAAGASPLRAGFCP